MVVPERTIWILKGLHLEFNRGLFNLNSLCVEGWGSFISSVFMPWRRHQIQPSFNDLCIEPKDIQQHRRNTKMSFSKAAEDCHNWNNSPFRTCCQIWDCYILLTIMSGLHWVKGDSHIDVWSALAKQAKPIVNQQHIIRLRRWPGSSSLICDCFLTVGIPTWRNCNIIQ